MNKSIFQKIVRWLIRPFALVITGTGLFTWLVITISLLLSGCVHYDLGVSFDHANSGQLIQHIQLTDKLTTFSGSYIDEWLDSIESHARKVEGSTIRVSPEEIIVKIPFNNSEELKRKFQQFFNNSIAPKPQSGNQSKLSNIKSNLVLEQNNFLLLVRNRLTYDLDLRALALVTRKDQVSPIVDLDFIVQTPWGAKNIKPTRKAIEPEKHGNQMVWKLQPGELNHIEVIFWLPSPLGIGAVLIILFVWGGFYLRYTFMPDPAIQFASKTP